MRFIAVCLFLVGLFSTSAAAAASGQQPDSTLVAGEALVRSTERLQRVTPIRTPLPVPDSTPDEPRSAEQRELADSSARILGSLLERMPERSERIGPLENRRARYFICNVNLVSGFSYFGDGFTLSSKSHSAFGSVRSYTVGGSIEVALFSKTSKKTVTTFSLGCEFRYLRLHNHNGRIESQGGFYTKDMDRMRCGYFCAMPYLHVRAWRMYLNIGVDNWWLKNFSLKNPMDLLGVTRDCINKHRVFLHYEGGLNWNRFRLGIFWNYGLGRRAGIFDLNGLAYYTRRNYKEENSGEQLYGISMALKLWRNGY